MPMSASANACREYLARGTHRTCWPCQPALAYPLIPALETFAELVTKPYTNVILSASKNPRRRIEYIAALREETLDSSLRCAPFRMTVGAFLFEDYAGVIQRSPLVRPSSPPYQVRGVGKGQFSSHASIANASREYLAGRVGSQPGQGCMIPSLLVSRAQVIGG